MGEVTINGLYRHYKGNYYTVLEIGRHTETLEQLVVYKALYGNHEIWIRPLNMFQEQVIIDGKSIDRFEYIGMYDDKEVSFIIDLPGEIREGFFELGISLEEQIKQWYSDVTIKYENGPGEKGAEIVIIASAVAVSIILSSLSKLISTMYEKPIVSTIKEWDSEGNYRETPILLEPEKLNREVKFSIGGDTSKIAVKFSDRSENPHE